MESNLQTPKWDNSNVYKSFQDPQIENDLQFVDGKLKLLSMDNFDFKNVERTRQAYRLHLDLLVILFTLRTYASTALSIDSKETAAQNLLGRVVQKLAAVKMAIKPLELFLKRSSPDELDTFLKHESVDEVAFSLRHDQKENPFLLSAPEEVLLEGHAVDGFHAWARLYTDLSGSLTANVAGAELGLADASNILFKPDREQREVAYRAINTTWKQNEVSAAAILNSLAGWRTENNRARSTHEERHFLDQSCHQQRISRKTLNTLMDCTFSNRKIGLDALRVMNHELGAPQAGTAAAPQMGPWDLLAPYPHPETSQLISFPAAMDLIDYAFREVNPEMADFARMMVKKSWIDASPSKNRGQGGYCTGFVKNRETRIFMTYDGSMKNVMTLAHEIGHAYHSWVMRDLKFGQTQYPSTLAETASIFAETLVREALFARAQTVADKKLILWQDVESAATLIINIPARFEFEKRLMELRKTKTVSPTEMKKLNVEAWQHWYGDTLSEYNEMFWASKMHFSMSHVSFYNYPYLFGYLFSLGIYAKKEEYGEGFNELYLKILRDTGTMTAEDLIQKHFQEDISEPGFWQKSFRIVEKSIVQYQSL